MEVSSRIVNVILTTVGDENIYSTLEGIMIGKFKGGERQAPKEEISIEAPNSAIVKSPKPEQVKREQEKENEETVAAEGALRNVKSKL